MDRDRAEGTTPPPVRLVGGPLAPALVALAWPVLGALGLKIAFNIVDVYWVGRLGATAVAALTTASFLYWLLLALSETVTVGTLALVARATGAGDRHEVGRVGAQALLWGLLSGSVAGVGFHAAAPAVFAFMGVAPEVQSQGVGFIRVLAWGAPFLFAWSAADAFLRGRGEPRLSMLVYAGAIALNATLDPVLILGLGPIPALGVRGAALATVIAFALAAALGAHLVVRRAGATIVREAFLRPRADVALRILGVGLPVSANGSLFSLVYVALTRTTTRFGTPALAALGIGHKLESLAYLPAVALGSAAATLVGQALGARDPVRARRAAWLAVTIASSIAALATVAFLALPEVLVRLFVSDPAVVATGAAYLRIVAVAQILQAWEVTLDGAFGGAGNTLPPMFVGVPLTLIRLPLASFLALEMGLGVNGIFWAISASSMAKGVVLAVWFALSPLKRADR